MKKCTLERFIPKLLFIPCSRLTRDEPQVIRERKPRPTTADRDTQGACLRIACACTDHFRTNSAPIRTTIFRPIPTFVFIQICHNEHTLTETFTLFEATPVPFDIDGGTYTINTGNQFFAVDENLQSFIPLSEQEEKQCTQIEGKVICHTKTSIIAKTENCELYLLNTPSTEQVHNHCRIDALPKNNNVTQIADSSTYFLHVRKHYTIKVFCGEQTSSIHIQTHGYLTLSGNCRVSAPKNLTSTIKITTTIIPEISLHEVKTKPEEDTTVTTTFFKKEILNNLIDEANELKRMEEHHIQLETTRKTGNLSLYCTISVVFICVGLGLRIWHTSTKPTTRTEDTLHANRPRIILGAHSNRKHPPQRMARGKHYNSTIISTL